MYIRGRMVFDDNGAYVTAVSFLCYLLLSFLHLWYSEHQVWYRRGGQAEKQKA